MSDYEKSRLASLLLIGVLACVFITWVVYMFVYEI